MEDCMFQADMSDVRVVFCPHVAVPVQPRFISELVFPPLAEASICRGWWEKAYVALCRLCMSAVSSTLLSLLISSLPVNMPRKLCHSPATALSAVDLRVDGLATTWEASHLTNRASVLMQLDVWRCSWIRLPAWCGECILPACELHFVKLIV